MEKIGLVTFYQNNYGSVLQCYATERYLKGLGVDCELLSIRYQKTDLLLRKFERLVRLAYNSIRYRGYYSNWAKQRRAAVCESHIISIESKIKIDNFVSEYLNKKGYTWRQLCDIGKNDSFKAFISGSDQVWNVSREVIPLYFLRFAPKNKRIALAVSIGASIIPEYNRRKFISYASGFERISVREETAVKIIKDCVNIPVHRDADPVILLEEKEWRNFYKETKKYERKYILLHFLNQPSVSAINVIKQLAKNVDVLCIAYFQSEFEKLENIRFVDVSPQEYVSFIDNAEFVCTDSFHTTMFSIMLHSNFATFSREYLHNESQESRVADLLDRYHLKEHFNPESGAIEKLKMDRNTDYMETIRSERNHLKKYIAEEINQKVYMLLEREGSVVER